MLQSAEDSRHVGERSKARELVRLLVCRHEFEGLADGGGLIAIRKFGLIRREVVIKDPVVLVSVLLHALDKRSNMPAPLPIYEKHDWL